MYRWNGACSISDRCTGQYGTFPGDQRSDKICISRLDHRTDQCFVQVVIYGQLGIITVPMGIRAEFYIVTACFTILGVWQHRANIRRLANGTENKIGAKKKEQK